MEDQDSEDEEIYFLGSYGTIEVLEYIKDHPQCEKRDLTTMVEDITVVELIETLQERGLVDRECTLTNKGRILLKCLDHLREILVG